MTIVVVNQAGGADFTSLQAAINAAPATLTEVYEIQLEPGNYVGDLIIPTRLSESYNNCINITHTPGNRATAFGGGTGAHILGNSGGHANTVNGGFVWYQGVAVTLDTTNGNSDEAFRVVRDNTLFQSCFIDAVNIQNAQDGFYLGGAALQRATISSCVIRGFYRAALHIQRRNRTVVSNFIYELYHNTIVDCGVGPTGSVAGVMLDVTFTNASGLTAADVSGEAISYNNVVANVAGYNSNVLANRPDTEALAWRNFSRTLSGENGGTIIWTGQGNTSHQDNSVEEKFGVTDNYGLTTLVDVEPTSGENIYVTDYLGGDFSIAGENAFTVSQSGVSVPITGDARTDLTVDITGSQRPEIGTIGAFQFQTSDLFIVDDTNNQLSSDNIALVQSFTMVPADSNIGIETEEVELSQGYNLAANDIALSLIVDNVDLLQNNLLTAAENLVSVSTDNVGLTQASVLPSDDAAHGLTVDTVTLDQSMQLPANSSTFAVTADNVALTQANIVAAADSLIAVTTDNVDLAQNLALSVLGTTNTLQTATLQLEQGNLLQLANMVIATLVDNVDLSQSSALTMSDTLHGMLTDQITLTQGATVNPAKSFLSLLSAEALIEVANVLNVFSSAHNSTTDNAAIIQNSFLEIADVLNSVQTESVTISTGQILDLQGVTHLTSSDQFALTEAVILIAINNVHAVNVDDFDLGFAILLTVETSIASTTSNNIELTTSQLLAANNAINAIATDSLELLQNTSLIVSSALHQHLSAQLGLFSGEITTPESRTIKIQRDNRIILILPDAPLH